MMSYIWLEFQTPFRYRLRIHRNGRSQTECPPPDQLRHILAYSKSTKTTDDQLVSSDVTIKVLPRRPFSLS